MSRAVADDRGLIGRIEVPERCVGYGVYDPLGKKIDSIEKIFVNENHEPEYVRVRMDSFGFESVLIPAGFVEIDEERQLLVLQ